LDTCLPFIHYRITRNFDRNRAMRSRLLKSKIHRATVTDANIDYYGSITIDQDLMDAAGVVDHEKVLVANMANGSRHETYVIPGAPGSGVICSNGAAAHLVSKGDEVIIMAFADFEPDEIAGHKPKIILVDKENRPRK
jgi:aspartate 1-decarboxylase